MPTGDVHDVRDEPANGIYWGYLEVKETHGQQLSKSKNDDHMLYIGPISDPNAPFTQIDVEFIQISNGNKLCEAKIALLDDYSSFDGETKIDSGMMEKLQEEYQCPKYGVIDTAFPCQDDPDNKRWGYVKVLDKYRWPTTHCPGHLHEYVFYVGDKKYAVEGAKAKFCEIGVDVYSLNPGPDKKRPIMIGVLEDPGT